MMVSALLAAEDSLYGIGVAIVIAVGGFCYTIYNGVRTDRKATFRDVETAMNQRITDLKSQVDELRDGLDDCTKQRRNLEREKRDMMEENLELHRTVRQLKNGTR